MKVFNEYSEMANSTALYLDKIIYPTLGLCGEAGEVAEKVKKVLRDSKGVFTEEKKEEIKKELGDVLWYINALSTDLGFTLEEVATLNIEKLFKRKSENKIQGSGDNR